MYHSEKTMELLMQLHNFNQPFISDGQTSINGEETMRNEGTRLNVTVTSIEEVSRNTLVEMSQEELEEMLKNNKEITIHLPSEWSDEQRQKAIDGFTAMQNKDVVNTAQLSDDISISIISGNGKFTLGRNAPPHPMEWKFCNNLISSSFCPRCGESIKECGSSRSVHYRRYHFPIYYSLSQPLYKKEFIDQWLSVELGSRSTEWRVCQICDGKENILFKGRLTLLIHIKKAFYIISRSREAFCGNEGYIPETIQKQSAKNRLQPQEKYLTSEVTLTSSIEVDTPPLKMNDPVDQRDIDFISHDDKLNHCPRCSLRGFSHSNLVTHYRSAHFGVYFKMVEIPLTKYEKWLSVRLGQKNEGFSRECPHCIKPTLRFFGRVELLKHIRKNHIAVFLEMEKDYLNKFWNEKPENEEIHRLLVDCALVDEWTKRN
ncbi:hypothetical protein PRIPAC_70566 [Pristionchus pacificus]|uniref:Uncharacterized protein n=1 Tax=Pristionchus pacificus TaxID=54126 RepID=A0A2A6CAH9_PRIPA|nr:hypothetical protein PRIPAC_70566 [Pristionchus pacificus]|eukprot:PDM75184.1 hypothetical protein PRIPAC_40565 [Pristionchus pacificus]